MQTLDKSDYLRLVAKHRQPLYKREWFVKAFTIVTLKDEPLDELEMLDIALKNDGLYAVIVEDDGSKSLAKLTGYQHGQPLFTTADRITVDSSVMSNIEKPTDMPIGNLIVNAIVTLPELEKLVPFFYGPISSISRIQKTFGLLTKDSRTPFDFFSTNIENDIDDPTKKDPTEDYVTTLDFVRFMNRCRIISTITPIISVAVTRKVLETPKGLKEYKEQLLKEYGDRIKDPLVMVEFEKKLMEYDKKYLADDPVANNVFVGKSRLGRFRTNVLQGNKMDFVDDPDNDTFLVGGVADGVDPTPSEFVKLANDGRFGSYGRGTLTAIAGYRYKLMQNALTTLSISPEKCNTTVGFVKEMTELEAEHGAGREIKVMGKWHKLEDITEAKKYLGKEVEMRSPMYCKAPGDTICYACLSERYKEFAGATTHMATDMTATMMTMFLKMMHATSTDATTIKMTDLIT